MLKINNLSVKVDNKQILNNFNLEINNNEIHAIMGVNGVGKSSICKTIMGSPKYEISKGTIIFNDKDLLEMDVTQRAREGIFLLDQNPIAIPGVTNAEMLRLCLNEKAGTNISIYDFNQKMEKICKDLKIPKSFIHRAINDGMSGGEKKKNELLHLWMLEPKLIILDELDSGLDVDNLRIVCESINEYKKTHDVSILIITHHYELLKLLNCNFVHILSNGEIIKSGDLSLAKKIEKNGYVSFNGTNRVSENE